jgi:hypothetical protein
MGTAGVTMTVIAVEFKRAFDSEEPSVAHPP